MPDPTPAAAAPAVPAAAPAAPAPAPAPAPAAPVASAAPAADPTPAPAAPEPSLLDAAGPAGAPAPTPEQALAAARELIAKHEAGKLAADPNARLPDGSKAAWLLSEGVMGQGAKPDWFKADKYASVAKQAEAYTALESRFGSFTGAPKDGKYEFTPNEAVKSLGVEIEMAHPLLAGFTKWAQDSQLSQKGYNELLNQLAEYEAGVEQARTPDMAKILGSLGENANTRVSNAGNWVKANLGAEGYAELNRALSGQNAAAVFKVVEALIGRTSQARLPGPNVNDAPAPVRTGEALAAIKALQGAKLPNGKLRVLEDSAYAAEVNRKYQEYFASMPEGFEYRGTLQRTTLPGFTRQA